MGGTTGRGRIRLEHNDDGTVVVKRADSPEHRLALAHEAAQLGALAHPGLVQLVKFEETPAYSELSTVYAGALTLADFSPSSLGSAAGVVAGVAAVVADMHAAGISHGAVAAEHVILGESRHPVLCSLSHAASAEPQAVTADVQALGNLLEATSQRCPRPANRMARRQAGIIGDAVQLARKPGAAAKEVAALLAGLPGAVVPDGERAAVQSDTTRTWRGRVAPLERVAGSRRHRFGFALWCVGLVLALWALQLLGSAGMTVPVDPGLWLRWVSEIGGAAAIVAVLRLVALICAWYLTVVTLVGVLGRRSGVARVVVLTDRASPAFLRSLLGSAAGLGVSAVGLSIAVVPLLATPPQPPAPSLVTASADSAAASARVSASTSEREPSATPAAAPTGTSDTVADPARPFELDFGPMAEVELDVEAETADVWVVRTGDHFWGIAEETLADLWGRQPDQVEIARYWRRLVHLNHDRLVAPGNPDLLYPDQVMLLPAP